MSRDMLVERRNSSSALDRQIYKLRKLAVLIGELADLPATMTNCPETALETLAAIAEITLNEHLPHVECWCVVERRPSPFKDDKGEIQTSIRTGHTTAAQARAYAKMFDARERATFAKHPWWGPYQSKWTAERAFISVRRIVHPKHSAAQYLKSLPQP